MPDDQEPRTGRTRRRGAALEAAILRAAADALTESGYAGLTMEKVASAVPAWTDQVAQQANELGWDGFWAQHPAGAGRLTKLDATTYEDAVRAARELALTTRTHHAPGNRQAQGVLQLADGSFHAASLGMLDEAIQGLALLRMGSYPGYWRPTATSLVPELLAVVGGASMVDLRGKFGVPVKA